MPRCATANSSTAQCVKFDAAAANLRTDSRAWEFNAFQARAISCWCGSARAARRSLKRLLAEEFWFAIARAILAVEATFVSRWEQPRRHGECYESWRKSYEKSVRAANHE